MGPFWPTSSDRAAIVPLAALWLMTDVTLGLYGFRCNGASSIGAQGPAERPELYRGKGQRWDSGCCSLESQVSAPMGFPPLLTDDNVGSLSSG
jgi:hypothetical protein